MTTITVRDPAAKRVYELDGGSPVAEGGEAIVYNVKGHPSVVAKIYKKPRPERAAKLAFMLANPPRNPTAAQNHQAYAWPTALLSSTTSNSSIGFLMPRISGMKEVFTFYNPRARRETCAHFDYRYLMQTARNIAGVMAELHSRGYLIADVSQKNLLVSDAALVTVLDTDSFEFRDPKTNFLHLCNVRTPGFIAPEGYAAAQNDPRAIEEDRFALAVVIFHLLMEGVHPFACKYSGGGEAPRLQQNVAAGRFPYALQLGGAYGPMPAAPPFTMLPATIQNMFERCFVAGHKTPAARPAALEWQKALAEASKNLVVCAKQKHHYYGAHLGADCPWCARIRMGFRDPFPEVIQRAAASGRPSAAPKVSKKASVKAGVPLRKRLLYLALAAFVMFLLAAIFG